MKRCLTVLLALLFALSVVSCKAKKQGNDVVLNQEEFMTRFNIQAQAAKIKTIDAFETVSKGVKTQVSSVVLDDHVTLRTTTDLKSKKITRVEIVTESKKNNWEEYAQILIGLYNVYPQERDRTNILYIQGSQKETDYRASCKIADHTLVKVDYNKTSRTIVLTMNQ